MPDGSSWPRISIVTPSLNQGQFIEETIRSVLLQGYPNLEYIVIDGGSNDCSVEIIKKYEKWLAYWTSAPDKGQSHAINKGFSKASGRIFAYLNSDDVYEPGALATVANSMGFNGNMHLLAGECTVFSNEGPLKVVKPRWPDDLTHFLHLFGSTFAQPATFWSRAIFNLLNGFDENFNFCFDREFFLRIGINGISPLLLSERLSKYRDHPLSKTRTGKVSFFEESIRLIKKHRSSLALTEKAGLSKIRYVKQEWGYIKVFLLWKQNGRISAAIYFSALLMKHPRLLMERRILKLARRLITDKKQNVKELEEL